ncbi:hypothetical protein [Streptomyces sp. NPDC004976]
MTGRYTTFSARLSGLAIALSLALGVTACSDDSPEQDHASAAAPQSGSSSAPRAHLPAGAALAELQGPDGLTLTIRGDLTNGRAEATVVPAALRGNDLKVLRTGPSLAGATVVDFARDKRYYVLRDADGRPLTTTGLSTLKPRERARVFMQFPAPPASTATVGFHLPLFDTADIKISG